MNLQKFKLFYIFLKIDDETLKTLRHKFAINNLKKRKKLSEKTRNRVYE